MKWTDKTINTINLLVAVIGLVITPIISAYVNKNDEKSKSLTASFSGPLDPLKDLADGQAKIDFELKSEGQVIPRVYIYRASLSNSGVAVLPTDFYSNIKVTTRAPWKIIAVGSKSLNPRPQEISLPWSKVSDYEFVADPTLINPGDYIDVNVYLTAPREEVEKLKYDSPAPITWETRVANLSEITISEDPVTKAINEIGLIQINIWGWGVPFIILVFAILTTIHFSILNTLKNVGRHISLCLKVTSAILCLCAAEAITTYVFGDSIWSYNVSNLFNIPPLLLNIGFLFVIYIIASRKSVSSNSLGSEAAAEGD
ncbi:hypothetical protein [Agrobacterium sp. NPDC089420]|uniref:hypothetical protein n=1 Tax=Agrobacterium sp. NPDC089420 TaxID=3363918 RepID=UPI00384F4F00